MHEIGGADNVGTQVTKKRPTVFISYGGTDELKARTLYEDLETAGVSAWFDKEALLPGELWEDAVARAIRNSDYVVVLLSSSSVERTGYVQKEIRIALDLLDHVPHSKIYVIPARLDHCVPTHDRLRELNWVDMYPVWEDGLTRILRVVLGNTCSGQGGTTSRTQMQDHQALRKASAILGDLIGVLEQITAKRSLITGVSTGIPLLDEMTAGLQRGQLIAVGAPVGTGKRAFAMGVALKCVEKGDHQVVYFSLNLVANTIMLRMLVMKTRIDSYRLRTGRLTKDEWSQLIRGVGELGAKSIFIDSTPDITSSEVETRVRNLQKEGVVDLVVIDYLQLMGVVDRFLWKLVWCFSR